MQIVTHQINNTKIAEVASENIIINTIEDGSDLLGNLYYSDFDKVIILSKTSHLIFLIFRMEWPGRSCRSFQITGCTWQ